MKIGELSKLTGCPVTTIRFFEAKKLIKPSNRTLTGHRIYSEQSLERLKFIMAAKENGMKLSCIQKLVEFEDDLEVDNDDLSRRLTIILNQCKKRKLQLALLEDKLKSTLKQIENKKKEKASLSELIYLNAKAK